MSPPHLMSAVVVAGATVSHEDFADVISFGLAGYHMSPDEGQLEMEETHADLQKSESSQVAVETDAA